MAQEIEITFRVQPEQAAALLKFLRRVGFGAVAKALDGAEEAKAFTEARAAARAASPGRRAGAGLPPMADKLFRTFAHLDAHFAADADRWRAFKRHIIRMKDGLDLVETTLREQREQGVPLTADTARKLEGYVRFGLGQSAE